MFRQQTPTLENPISQPCTEAQFRSPIYAHWCEKIGETPRLHRKQWEFVYIHQTLNYYGFLKRASNVLGSASDENHYRVISHLSRSM
jgi:hypothetical protein